MKEKIEETPCEDTEAPPNLLSQLCVDLGNKSLEMVENRYQSLLSATSHLMTCISIVSVALFSLLPVLLNALPVWSRLIAMSYFAIFAVLVAALVLVLVARYRFQYDIPQSPGKLVDFVVDHRQEFKDSAEIGQFYGRCLEDSYSSMQERNDRISSLTKASFGLLISCLVLAYGLFAMIVLIQVLFCDSRAVLLRCVDLLSKAIFVFH